MIRTGLYRFELAEFQEGMWLTVRLPAAKKFRSLAILGTASLAASGVLFFVDVQARFIALTSAVFGLVAIAFSVFRRQVTYLLAAKLIRNRRSRAYRGEHSAEFTEDGFVGQSWPGGRTELAWPGMRAWSKGGRVIVLHIGEMGGIIIPRRALSNEEDVNKLEALLTSRLGNPLP